MDYGCPSCYGIEFGVSGHVTFVGSFQVEPGEEPWHNDDEILWETQEVTFVECSLCGWCIDTPGHLRIEEILAPILDPSVEDVPDEKDIDTPVLSHDERVQQVHALSGGY